MSVKAKHYAYQLYFGKKRKNLFNREEKKSNKQMAHI